MRRRVRLAAFGASLLVLAGLLAWGVAGLPHFGEFGGAYGEILNRTAVGQRHATNVVATVVFDYRGLDTLGEEFILFAAVMGVAMLLREARDKASERPYDEERSEAVRAVGLTAVAATLLLGLSIAAHGYITPGGGFQGGATCASALALLYVAGRYRAYRRVSPVPLLELAEGVGAGGYAAMGIAGLLTGAAFLENVLPLGSAGQLPAAGTIAFLNAAAALAIAAALALLFHEFLEELLDPTERGSLAR